jgi:hypothetical protein
VIEHLIGAAVGGFGFWLRGSALFEKWTGRGATTARITCWALPLGLFGWALGLPPIEASALAVAAWIGCLAPWWDSLDLGRQEGTWLRDFAWHTLRGALWVAPIWLVVLLSFGSWWPLAVVALLCGIVYELGYRLWPAKGTEVGEALFGALIGLALAQSLTTRGLGLWL